MRVPVLSKTTAVTRPMPSRWVPPLMRVPRRAPLPMAALIAVGVARPAAQGQAISSIVIARRASRVSTYVIPARANETGTKRRVKAVATVWIGARSA